MVNVFQKLILVTLIGATSWFIGLVLLIAFGNPIIAWGSALCLFGFHTVDICSDLPSGGNTEKVGLGIAAFYTLFSK